MYHTKLDEHVVYRNSLKQLELTKVKQQVLTVVRQVLKTFDGKMITKRIATAVEKTLPDNYHVYLDDDNRTLYVWGNQISYDSRLRIRVKYNEYGDYIPRFNYEKWFNLYGTMCDLTESINNLQEAMKDITARVSEYNDALAKFEQAENGMRHLVYN